MVYGEYGEGKTRLAATAALVPQMRDVLFADCEAGDTTVATIDDPGFVEAIRDHVNVVRVSSYKTLARVHEFLKVHCRFRDDPEGEDKLKQLEKMFWGDRYNPDIPAVRYYTVVLDSLSEAETFDMYDLLGITDRTKLDDEIAAAEWTEFKKNHTQMLRLIRGFRDLPMNVIMTAAADTVQNENKKQIFKPMLTGKLAKQSQGFMDVVGFLATVQGDQGARVRRLFVTRSPSFDAKCRFSSFKRGYWDNPSLDKILKEVGLMEPPADGSTAEKAA